MLIHCIEMSTCQELPFREDDETEELNNTGHFLSTCETVAEYGECLRSHLDVVKKIPTAYFMNFQVIFKTRPLTV